MTTLDGKGRDTARRMTDLCPINGGLPDFATLSTIWHTHYLSLVCSMLEGVQKRLDGIMTKHLAKFLFLARHLVQPGPS